MPEQVLQTRRLRLRPFRRGDEGELARHLGDWEITRMLAPNPHPYDTDHAEAWIDECLAQPNGHKYGLRLAIEEPNEPALAGGIGLTPGDDAGFELGYWIARPLWGRGYATEAASAVVQTGLTELGYTEICALVFGENPASVRVLEKIGFGLVETLESEDAGECGRPVHHYLIKRPG